MLYNNSKNTKVTINGGKNMQGNVMSFKAKINNISKEKKVAPQSVLQVYMLERLLERLKGIR